MKILVSGASGLIGARLCAELGRAGHEATALVRGEDWSVETGRIERKADAVVHLAGENIASGRWIAGRKRIIHESRGPATRRLCEFLAGSAAPPRVFVCASAVGIYGNRGDEELSEYSALGDGFLAEVCREWEAATKPLAETSCRVVSARFGIVLSREGGALAKMLPIFRAGLGGPLGNGRHWMSWVAIDDAVAALKFFIENDGAMSPFNVAAPNPVTNRDFTRTLARTLGKPAFLPAPRIALKLAFGEMADGALLASQRVLPARLAEMGFVFKYPELESALRHVLEHPHEAR